MYVSLVHIINNMLLHKLRSEFKIPSRQCMLITPPLRKWWQEDREFKASLHYLVSVRPAWLHETVSIIRIKQHHQKLNFKVAIETRCGGRGLQSQQAEAGGSL